MPIYFGLTSRELPLTVESIGNGWQQEVVRRPNGYPHYHWIQTESGAGDVDIAGDRLQLPPQAGILISPFIPHSYYPLQSGWTTAFVTFTGELEAEISAITGRDSYIPAADTADFSYQGWIGDVIASHNAQQLEPSKLSVACYNFLMNIRERRSDKDSLAHPLYRRYVRPVIKDIEINYYQDITASSLAESAYISQQYLNRLFKRFLGCSTYQYLISFRLNKAKEFLANYPGMEIQQVGHRVGIHDTSHFIVMFKALTGCTPMEFRRLHH